jgi:predicted TIM-barrel fold metal-dependent hydrolase
MAWAPLSKIVIGSGGHGSPEIAWLAALTAKTALSEVLGDTIRLNLIATKYAEAVSRMILHDNASRLYGID